VRPPEAGPVQAPPFELLERDEPLAALQACLESARAGQGRLALVVAEAGGGKTALVERFCAENVDGLDAFWGACDPLSTPRPLAPFLDIAASAGGELSRLAQQGAGRDALLEALLARVRGGALQVLVIEDAHWADEATLDLLLVLGRRVASTRSLIVVTYRDEEVGPQHPLRAMLGDLPSTPVLHRLTLAPLSAAAVTTLAALRGRDARDLHARAGGNPFFVTEVLDAGGADSLPETVRDAVLARAARLSPDARQVLNACAVIPLRVEPWLLSGLLGPNSAALEECVSAGMLLDISGSFSFRHELARQAVEEAIPRTMRVELHHQALALLKNSAHGEPDPSRLTHHALAADLRDEVLRYAPAAAARAASLGSHREAATLYRRALEVADTMPLAERVEMLGRYAGECYLIHQLEEAVEAVSRAIEGSRALGDRRGEGDALRRLSRYLWIMGRSHDARPMALAAVELLESLEPGPELAMAWGVMSHLAMVDQRVDEAIDWGTRAIALAEPLGADETVAHALNTIGTAELLGGIEAGREKIERSLALALDAGLAYAVARAYNNLGWVALHERRGAPAERWLTEGIIWCEEHGMELSRTQQRAELAGVYLMRGDIDEAERLADEILRRAGTSSAFFDCEPFVVRGLIRARRGDAGAWEDLDRAESLAVSAGEIHGIATVLCARAEAAWIEGDDARAADEARRARDLAPGRWGPWYRGEIAAWLRRGGAAFEPGDMPAPYALETAGRWREAAETWDVLGCRYEAALCRCQGDDPAALRQGLEALEALGASATASRVSRDISARGTRLPRRPRRTGSNVLGLTGRELEVLRLVATGLSNRGIGRQLFVAESTAARHVANLFAKLGASSRAQAVAIAAQRGLIGEHDNVEPMESTDAKTNGGPEPR
jgi:DNA-binding CsgD family transcriptional regulator